MDKNDRTQRIIVIAARAFLIGAFFLAWELLAQTGMINAFLFSSPSRIVSSIELLYQKHNLYYHIWITSKEVLLGFLFATALGFLIAVSICWSNFVTNMLEPVIAVFNSIPKIAFVPLIITWFDGGEKSAVATVVFMCVFITILDVLNHLLHTDKEKEKLMRSFAASKWQILTKLSVPYNLPNFFNTLKINIGLAWIGAIFSELFSSTAGLGYLISLEREMFNYSIVMACIIIVCAVSSFMFLALDAVRNFVLEDKYTR